MDISTPFHLNLFYCQFFFLDPSTITPSMIIQIFRNSMIALSVDKSISLLLINRIWFIMRANVVISAIKKQGIPEIRNFIPPFFFNHNVISRRANAARV